MFAIICSVDHYKYNCYECTLTSVCCLMFKDYGLHCCGYCGFSKKNDQLLIYSKQNKLQLSLNLPSCCTLGKFTVYKTMKKIICVNIQNGDRIRIRNYKQVFTCMNLHWDFQKSCRTQDNASFCGMVSHIAECLTAQTSAI